MALLTVGLAGLAGCGSDNTGFLVLAPTPTAAPTTAPTPTPAPTATATPPPTATATPPPTATATPPPTVTATARATQTPRTTGTPTATATATPKATATLAPEACLPSSSIGVLVQGKNAAAYAPRGAWPKCGGATGVNVVPIETSAGVGKGGAPSTITTPNVVNSCSSNSVTGQTVCVANNTDVYLISGTTLNRTLTSGAIGTEPFSGGACMNCGVVVDSSTHKALITVGLETVDALASSRPVSSSSTWARLPPPLSLRSLCSLALRPRPKGFPSIQSASSCCRPTKRAITIFSTSVRENDQGDRIQQQPRKAPGGGDARFGG